MIPNKKTQLILYKEQWEQVEFLDRKKIKKINVEKYISEMTHII
jgi:hypothetical protein